MDKINLFKVFILFFPEVYVVWACLSGGMTPPTKLCNGSTKAERSKESRQGIE